MNKISQEEIATLFPNGLPPGLVKVVFPELSTPLTPDEMRFIMQAVAFQIANDRTYMIGPRTLEQVFEAAGLVNMSDLQAVMDAVERALTPKPLEWKRGDYISSAQSINTLAFTVQYIGDGDEGWALHTYLTNETKRTRHETREAAEQAAQALHNAELAKYLSG